jgi:ABC-type polysaccharide/polyol phosphate transport system ATPase subunit
MEKVAITVKKLNIKYRGLKKIKLRKVIFSRQKDSRVDISEAIKDVSFEVEKGKILGIVGKNGSGKSTLLRAIAGIFSPDKGNIDIHGNSVSLLSIGVGFLPKLSGRENIYLAAMLLGFSKSEIDKKVDDIIEFSELGNFIEKPVQSYSSGMYSKLAFSITSTLETDIILIDEVLSVGDVKFKNKSYNRMKELISDDNRTVIIVSHSMGTLKSLCNEILWMHDGRVMLQGEPDKVIAEYEKFMT